MSFLNVFFQSEIICLPPGTAESVMASGVVATKQEFGGGSMSKRISNVIAICAMTIICLCLSTPAFAQYRTSIQGVVTDQQGSVVPGATLTLTNLSTNLAVIRKSNDAGIFNFNALPADRFSLVVEQTGFKKKVLSDLQLIPEQPNALNVQLEVGALSQTITVDASAAPAIDTETASITGTISSNQVEHMPSFGRDVFQLIQLAPGVFGDGAQGSGGGSQQLPGTQGPGGTGGNQGIFATENGPQALANGGQYENNGVTIDGISTASAVWGGTTIITPTEDSVGNVKVVSNGYDAENGRFSGAQIQVTSKSGTNQFHGSLFFDVHRPGLNAFQRYNGGNTLLRDNNRFNQFGGSVGGPIWKNKIFGFFAYETIRNRSNSVSNGWYDTSAFDALAPAGSIAAKFLTFPGSGVSSIGMGTSTCLQAGLVEGTNCRTIPGQGINVGSPLTTALGTQDPAWVSPNQPGLGGGLANVADLANFNTSSPSTNTNVQYNGRLDANISGKDRIGFAIYWVPVSSTFFNGPARAYNLFHHSQINEAFSAIWNHTFSPTFLNEARVNAAGWHWNEIASNPQQPVGLPQDNIGNLGSITPNFFGAAVGSVFDQWTYSYKDVATKVAGRHTMKFGGEITRLYFLDENVGAARPQFNFFNIWDFLNDAPRAESGNFDPTTGTPTAARQDNREDIWGFFVQDDFKLRRNLTVNLGLRYSYFGPLSSKQGNLRTAVLGAGANMVSGLTVRRGGNLWKAQKGNFGPQIGFAWSPASLHDKFVLRGGYGLSFNQEEISISSSGFPNPGSIISPNFSMTVPSDPNPGIVYAIPSDSRSLFGYPPNLNTIVSFGPNGLPTTGQVGVVAFSANLPTMYTHHYSLDTQYDLGHRLVATLGYSGSLSRNTYFHYDADAVAAVKGFVLNPQLNQVNFFGNSGSGNYNAMLVGLKHDFAHQFTADAEFTWAKSMDTSSAPFSEQDYPYNTGLNYGRSDYNVGKAFKLFGLWQPILFHDGPSWMERLGGGWSLSGILNLHTGFSWNPVVNVNGGSLYCSLCGYTQLLPGAYLGGAGSSASNDQFKTGANFPNAHVPNGPDGLAYFSAPTFTVAAAYPATGAPVPQSPGVRRNSLTGPGYRDFDATLAKSFGMPNIPGIGEGAKLEFRIDVFNLFNFLNFNPTSISNNVANSNFGVAQTALAARTVSMQLRFSF
jgi:hypothetical protein